MSSLTQTAYLSRKLINISIVVLVFGILAKMAFGYGMALWQEWFPPPPPPATVAFGKLPYPIAQNNVATPSGITYRLETIDNNLPVLPANLKVFHMIRPGPTFGSFQRMISKANQMDFTESPKKATETVWRFTDSTNPLRTLDIDEVTGNYRIVYNFLSDQSIFSAGAFSSEDQPIAETRSFFSSTGGLPDDLVTGTPSAVYLRLDAGALVPATSLSNTEAMSITLNRAPIEGMPIVNPDPKQGLISAVIAGTSDRKKQILDGRFFYTAIDSQNWATYPIIKSQEAFTLLQQGDAIFASVPNQLASDVTIRQVYVAYLDPYPPQAYIQPVLVFSDQKGFQAYVPLVTQDWLER